MIIAISGGNGCGTTTFSYFVYSYLRGSKVLINHGNLIRKISKNYGGIYNFLKILERKPWLERKIDEKIINYVNKLNKIYDFIIYESKLSPYFIKNSIKFWIGCGINTSAKRIAKRENISYEEAKKKTIKRYLSDRIRFYNLYKIKYPEDIKEMCQFSINTSYINNLDDFRELTQILLDKIIKNR